MMQYTIDLTMHEDNRGPDDADIGIRRTVARESCRDFKGGSRSMLHIQLDVMLDEFERVGAI